MSETYRGTTNCGDGCCFDQEDYDSLTQAMRWHDFVDLPDGRLIMKNYMGNQGWWEFDDLLRPVRPFLNAD